MTDDVAGAGEPIHLAEVPPPGRRPTETVCVEGGALDDVKHWTEDHDLVTCPECLDRLEYLQEKRLSGD